MHHSDAKFKLLQACFSTSTPEQPESPESVVDLSFQLRTEILEKLVAIVEAGGPGFGHMLGADIEVVLAFELVGKATHVVEPECEAVGQTIFAVAVHTISAPPAFPTCFLL